MFFALRFKPLSVHTHFDMQILLQKQAPQSQALFVIILVWVCTFEASERATLIFSELGGRLILQINFTFLLLFFYRN